MDNNLPILVYSKEYRSSEIRYHKEPKDASEMVDWLQWMNGSLGLKTFKMIPKKSQELWHDLQLIYDAFIMKYELPCVRADLQVGNIVVR